jgi:murein endopeptidase
VREDDLRAWNKKVPRAFKAGQKLVVWTNPRPTVTSSISTTGPRPLPVFDVPRGGYSMGLPNRGRLVDGVQLPDTDDYDVRRPEEAWGSSHTILNIQTALASFRRDSGYDGKIIVGAISKKSGGRFRPHRSHQSGRDVDIRLPKKKGADLRSDDPDDIDWVASWKMIKAFIDTGQSEYIFLDYSRQRRLLNAAKAAGASAEELEKSIQYPRGRHANLGIVRHNEGHLIHIHVRIACPKDQSRCQSDG